MGNGLMQTESTQQHTTRDWAATVIDLERQLEAARGERDDLEKRRRGHRCPVCG